MNTVKDIDIQDVLAAMWLIYGGWGVGKTYSLGTLPGKTMIVMSELKNIHRILSWAKGKYEVYPLAVMEDGNVRYRTFDEFMGQLNKWLSEAAAGKKPFDNLCIDSLSELQAIYGEAIEDKTHKRRLEEGKRQDEIIDRYKKELAGFGTLSSTMGRTTKLLQRFTLFGVNVICTAGVPDVSDTWTQMKPYLIGKEFPSLLAGYFDFIGYVTKGGGELPYPPVVRFMEDETGTYKAKCGDTRLARKGSGPLDWSKIFNLLTSNI